MRRVSLLRLIVVFAWTGLSSLGGGRSAYFHESLVRRRGALILLAASGLYAEGAFGTGATLLMRGLSAAVVGLVAVTSLRIMCGSLRGGRAAAIALLTFVAVGPLRLPTVAVVLVMTALSFALYRFAPGPHPALPPTSPPVENA